MTTVDTDVKFALPMDSKLWGFLFVAFFFSSKVLVQESFRKGFGGENCGALRMIEHNFCITEDFCVPSSMSKE